MFAFLKATRAKSVFNMWDALVFPVDPSAHIHSTGIL